MITCNQCVHLFITHDPKEGGDAGNLVSNRPKIPYQEVIGNNWHEMCLLQRRI